MKIKYVEWIGYLWSVTPGRKCGDRVVYLKCVGFEDVDGCSFTPDYLRRMVKNGTAKEIKT